MRAERKDVSRRLGGDCKMRDQYQEGNGRKIGNAPRAAMSNTATGGRQESRCLKGGVNRMVTGRSWMTHQEAATDGQDQVKVRVKKKKKRGV